ncbi:MAG: hypothetical protein GY933_16195 [Hyphomicrobiales bacterium]|nr:hypothetical protein [Hyphomicrobiales bacterium]
MRPDTQPQTGIYSSIGVVPATAAAWVLLVAVDIERIDLADAFLFCHPDNAFGIGERADACNYQGSKKFENLSVRNLTAERIANSGGGGGHIGTVIAISISSARGNQPDDDYTYERPDMDLNRKPTS